MFDHCMTVIGVLISITSLVISIKNHRSNSRQEKENEASKLVAKICDISEINEEDRKKFGENFVPQLVKIRNNSNGEFKDIFIVLVEDKEKIYVNKKKLSKKVKNLENISQAIKLGYYKHIENLIDEDEILVRSGGSGMHKIIGIILLFKDNVGNEWFKDTDNKLYEMKDMKVKLNKVGLRIPGYEI